jgi:nucleotide-binding universal stress UspA family protein
MTPHPKTIVCPLLCDNCLSTVLGYAAFLAKCFQAKLVITTIVVNREQAANPDCHAQWLDQIENLKLPQLQGVPYELVELSGEPTKICQFVNDKQADLVVLGNDVGNEGSPALGQLTRRIVDDLPCTVVVVKNRVRAPQVPTTVQTTTNTQSQDCSI